MGYKIPELQKAQETIAARQNVVFTPKPNETISSFFKRVETESKMQVNKEQLKEFNSSLTGREKIRSVTISEKINEKNFEKEPVLTITWDAPPEKRISATELSLEPAKSAEAKMIPKINVAAPKDDRKIGGDIIAGATQFSSADTNTSSVGGTDERSLIREYGTSDQKRNLEKVEEKERQEQWLQNKRDFREGGKTLLRSGKELAISLVPFSYAKEMKDGLVESAKEGDPKQFAKYAVATVALAGTDILSVLSLAAAVESGGTSTAGALVLKSRAKSYFLSRLEKSPGAEKAAGELADVCIDKAPEILKAVKGTSSASKSIAAREIRKEGLKEAEKKGVEKLAENKEEKKGEIRLASND